MIVDRYGKRALGVVLSDDILVKGGFDLGRRTDLQPELVGGFLFLRLPVFPQILLQILHTLIADENAVDQPADEFSAVLFGLSAERAVFLCHIRHSSVSEKAAE